MAVNWEETALGGLLKLKEPSLEILISCLQLINSCEKENQFTSVRGSTYHVLRGGTSMAMNYASAAVIFLTTTFLV